MRSLSFTTTRRAWSALAAAAAATLPALRAGNTWGLERTTLRVIGEPVWRDFDAEFDAAFAAHWQLLHGEPLRVERSHGQALAGTPAAGPDWQPDVILAPHEAALEALRIHHPGIGDDWRSRLPDQASPWSTAVVIVVRRGNPRSIADWADLGAEGCCTLVDAPQRGDEGRIAHLALWAAAKHGGASDAEAVQRLAAVAGSAPGLPVGVHAVSAFAMHGVGDALIVPEHVPPRLQRDFGLAFEVVRPRFSLRLDPVVALDDAVANARGTRRAAQALLHHLWSPEAQAIAARHGLRPRDGTLPATGAGQVGPREPVGVDEAFGGWAAAMAGHFAPGGWADRVAAAAGVRTGHA